MDDDFAASSTPPFLTESLEMAMEVENGNSKLPCFSCAFDNQNVGRSFSAESYLASGSLKRYGGFFSCKYNMFLRCAFLWCLMPLNADTVSKSICSSVLVIPRSAWWCAKAGRATVLISCFEQSSGSSSELYELTLRYHKGPVTGMVGQFKTNMLGNSIQDLLNLRRM